MIYLELPDIRGESRGDDLMTAARTAPLEGWDLLKPTDDDPDTAQGMVNPPGGQSVLEQMLPVVQMYSPVPLEPSHTFIRRVRKGGVMREHMDRPGLDWKLDIRLMSDADVPPLQVFEYGRWVDMICDTPRVAGLFRAGHLRHRRLEPYTGNEMVQLFCHYRETRPYIVKRHALDQYDLHAIFSNGIDWTDGVVYQDGEPVLVKNETIRRNSVGWLRREDGWGWLHEKLASIARTEATQWGVDAAGDSTDSIQCSRYQVGEWYDSHTDHNAGGPDPVNRRSLSIVVPIKDADEGGGLKVAGHTVEVDPGDAVIFEGDTLHEALEVVRGERQSIALWLAAKEPY